MSELVDPKDQELADAAQRMAEAVNLHVLAIAAEGSGRDQPGYVAIRLSDGRSPDGTLYDTRREAALRHRFEGGVCYIRVGRDSMPIREAVIVLQMHRMAYKRGVVFAEEDVVVPQMTELMRPFIPNTLKGLRRGPHQI
jgi:hypothetical protein